jgi:glycosyltransferase involved in cell wall biosynthesis
MIIYINSRFLTQQSTGVHRFAIEISKELKNMDIQVRFISPLNIIHNDIANELGAVKIGILTGHLWEQISLPRYLKKIGSPLLVNLCNTAPLNYINKVVTLHDITFKLFPNNFSFLFRSYYNFIIPRILQSSKKIITVSNFSKREILKHYNIKENKVDVVYNAVCKVFNPIKNENSTKYILGVSSLSRHKNFDMLIQAYNKIKCKDIKLYIVGGKNKYLRTSLTDEHNLNPNIIFTGRVSDKELAELYSNSLCFIFPSLYEGFGIPPLEAMACGSPVVVSNVASLPEVCGDAALYFDPSNIDNISETILKVIKNDRIIKDLRRKGFIRVKKYSWKKSANKLISIIDKK